MGSWEERACRFVAETKIYKPITGGCESLSPETYRTIFNFCIRCGVYISRAEFIAAEQLRRGESCVNAEPVANAGEHIACYEVSTASS